MSPRPPADAIVALRSLPRRYRGIFAGLGDDESPDDLAHRPGPEGRSAFDHIAAASRSLTTRGRALERILIDDDPRLDPMDTETVERERELMPGGTVEERLSELEVDALRVAAQADRASARDWARTGRLDDDRRITASEVLWEAVDSAVDHLKAAERTLQEVRGRPR